MKTEKEIEDKLREWECFEAAGIYPPDEITWDDLCVKMTALLRWVLDK